MQSIYSVITRRFVKHSLVPILLVEVSLVLTLLLLNNYQSKTNKKALQNITKESFQEIAIQTSGALTKRFSYDKSSLTQIQQMTAILFEHIDDFTISPNQWHNQDKFFQLNMKEKDAKGFYPLPASRNTSVYTTNLKQLEKDDYKILTTLSLLLPSIKATVETQNDLISSAWINIGKHYSMVYPPIEPAKELSPTLDVTKHPFYYLADPKHNPEKKAIFTPLYQEEWAIDKGEFGAYLIPIYKQNKFLGVIGLTLTGKAVADVIRSMDLPFNAYAILTDNDGRPIVSSSPKACYQDFGQHSFYELFQHPEYKERSLTAIDISQKTVNNTIIFTHPIPDIGLRLIIRAEKEEVFATINKISQRTLLVGSILIIAIILFYMLFFILSVRSMQRLANTIATPLRAIVNFSSKLGRNEGVVLESSSIDELEDLNINLNQTHEKLLQMVIKDEATGLYNRRKLLEDLQNTKAVSLMLIQLHNYKTLHNLYGQEAADAVVSGVVKEIKKSEQVQAYRIGDDDIALLNFSDDFAIFTKIFDTLSSLHISFRSIDIHPFLFAGIANENSASLPLFEQASIALLYAQRNISSYPVYYSDAHSIKKEFETNLVWSNRLNKAFQEDQLVPYFQPIYNLRTKKIEKFESLVRMIDGDEVIAPFHFLQAAADMGKTHEITKVMIKKVFAVAAKFPEISFNINISFKDFKEIDLLGFVQEQCDRHDVRAEQITFELLETDAPGEFDYIIKAITQLKKDGFSIAIDDFGTGHSNFAHLMSMQVDYIKIDGQFIKNILKDPNSATITKTIAQFASLMGAKTVAEFVSDPAIIKRIHQFNIDYAQGYAISPPLPEDQISTLLYKDFTYL